MPRHDWYDDDTMTRDRDYRRENGSRDRDMDRDDDRIGSTRRDSERGYFRDDRSDDRFRNRPIASDRDDSRRRERSSRDSDRARFGADDHNRGIPMDETRKLIASNKVEGTPVFDRHGDKLGSIHNFMVDKRRGHVVYAVLKHSGGFLGLNERYYPLEWKNLDYDTRLGGYHVPIEEEDLKSFGSFDSEGRYSRGMSRHDRNRDRDDMRGRDHMRDRDRW